VRAAHQPTTHISREIDEYRAEGVAVIRGIMPPAWLENGTSRRWHPGQCSGASVEYTPKDTSGRYYGDFFRVAARSRFPVFVLDSPLPELASWQSRQRRGVNGARHSFVQPSD